MGATHRYIFAFIAGSILFMGVTTGFLIVQREPPPPAGSGPTDWPVEVPEPPRHPLELTSVHRAGWPIVGEAVLDDRTLVLAFADGELEWWRFGSAEDKPLVLRYTPAPGPTIDMCGLADGTLASVHAGSDPRLVLHEPLAADETGAGAAGGDESGGAGTGRGARPVRGGVDEVAAEEGSAAAVAPEGSGSAQADDARSAALDGTPLDLWCDTAEAAVWVLLRTDEGGLIERYSGTPLQRTRRVETGPLPVGIFDRQPGRLSVPEYGGRVVHELATVEGGEHTKHAVDVRPATLGLVDGAIVVAPANEPVVVRIPAGAGGQPRPAHRLVVPAPLSLIRGAGRAAIGFAASTSTLYRFDSEMKATASSTGFDQVVAIEPLVAEPGSPLPGSPSPERVLLLDSGANPRLSLVDAATLDLVFEVALEGRPARVHPSGSTMVVISPAEGVITFVQVRR